MIKFNESGIHESQGLKFRWSDWVLCEVANRPSNPPHLAIFTHFWEGARGPRATRWQPSYEDGEHVEDLPLDSLLLWRPIMVICSLRDVPMLELVREVRELLKTVPWVAESAKLKKLLEAMP